MVKSTKCAIKAVLGNADISDEELTTIFTGVKDFLNLRPLTYQTANPEDNVPLTPNHVLYGQQGGTLVIRNDEEEYKNWLDMYDRDDLKNFTNTWKTNKMVLIQKESCSWWFSACNCTKYSSRYMLLGRVINTYPGDDGHIRTVKNTCNRKEYLWSINWLCPIDVFIEDKTKKDNEPNVHYEGGECLEEK